MANQEHSREPQHGPPHNDHMRDPDYLVRGYKAALFNRSTSQADRIGALSENRLTAWLEDISGEDRHRARVGLDGPPYDPAAARSADESREGKDRSWEESREMRQNGER